MSVPNVMTLVCRVPNGLNIDIQALRALLQVRINARAARADHRVDMSPAMIQRWIREEMDALAAELKRAQALAKPLN